MSAQVKYSIKKSSELKEIAKVIIKDICNVLANQDGSTKVAKLDIYNFGHGLHPFGSAATPTDYIDFGIGVEKNRYNELGQRDVEILFGYIKDEINALKKNKGYEGILYNERSVNVYCGNHDFYITFPYEVCLITPCKEWATLTRLISKYQPQVNLSVIDNYQVDLFGKRGQYDESGKRVYYCTSSEWCKKAIEFIRKTKTTRDILKVWSKVLDDDIDTNYSIRYETECYGRRKVSLKMQVVTPNGKSKGIFCY